MAPVTLIKRTVSLKEIYRQIYPWKTLDHFVEQLSKHIAYQSSDGSLVAIHKPFGVGIHHATDNNTSKQNQDKLLYKLNGSPKYCIDDALLPLTAALKLPQPLQVIKSIDRYMSGLVLLSTNPEIMKKKVQRSFNSSRCTSKPAIGMRCIACGIPTIKDNQITEQVGIQMTEVDELGDYKEPVIVQKVSRKFTLRQTKDARSFLAEMKVLNVNRELAVSYLELFVSRLTWDFPRVYISSKTSFILGDVRFSKRVREILGQKIQVSAFKSSHRHDDNYETLNSKLRFHLGVSENASIPLMLDVHIINLRNFDRSSSGKKDLLIQSPYIPLHFAHTAETLDLIEINKNRDSKE